jgi:hypothetical protein
MDISNKKSFARSGVIASLCLIAGSALNGSFALSFGIVLGLISGAVVVWQELRGPEEVDVRFSDDDAFGSFWERLIIQKTVNNCCVFLRRLELNPPTVSPVMGVGIIPTAIPPGAALRLEAHFGTGCLCPLVGHGLPDTSGFLYPRPYRKISIAAAYMHCFMFRLFLEGTGTPILEGYPILAEGLMERYFCHAFSGTPFVLLGADADDIDKWLAALLSVRNTCGKGFTDQTMAYALRMIVRSKPAEGEEFGEFFFKSVAASMMNRASRSSRQKWGQLLSILIERGVIKRGWVRFPLEGYSERG